MDTKKSILAAAFAGLMTLGITGAVLAPASTAAAAEKPPYEDGTTNEYSHRLHQEDIEHDNRLGSIRYEYRQDKNQKKYEKALKKEQERHDKVVKQIKRDYENHKHRHHHH